MLTVYCPTVLIWLSFAAFVASELTVLVNANLLIGKYKVAAKGIRSGVA